MKLTPEELNYISKDTIIYQEGEKPESIALIIEGTVFRSNGGDTEFSAGHFIGVQGLLDGTHCITYTAKTNLTLKVFKADNIKSVIEFFLKNPELQESMTVELSNFIAQLSQIYKFLYSQASSLYQSIFLVREHYLQQCELLKFPAVNIPIGKEIEDFELSAQSFYKELKFFEEFAEEPDGMPSQMENGRNSTLTLQLGTIINLYKLYLRLKSYTQRLVTVFVNEDSSLFHSITELAEYADTVYARKAPLVGLLEEMRGILQTTEEKLTADIKLQLNIDYSYVNKCLEKASRPTNIITDHPLNKPKETLHNLMVYGGFDEEKQKAFFHLIEDFIQLTDKYSREERHLKMYKQITELYYELYEAVFFTSINDPCTYKMVDLFLNFGFLDERLLTDEQIGILFTIKELEEGSPCKVYRMKDWLLGIYNGEQVPSKNEFDEDYFDMIRRKKKLEHLSKRQEDDLLNDAEAKTKFEIQNMFRYNNRLINGNITAFLPMLYDEVFSSNLKDAILTAEKINSSIESIKAIDYSIFYRELLYADEKAKITKEYIQKEIHPIIILFPICGVNGIMWQETTRRRSDSAGRFFLPSITAGNASIEDMLLKVIGRFRWELCKQLQGYSWNVITVHSLTSEYWDYVQFYRSSKELSLEKKELLKSQIISCRNNTREVFVSDYINWIKHESHSAIRLNNVARRILCTYCPFAKPIREQLVKQPLFEKAMFKYNLEKKKKIRELHNRYTALTNKGGILTQELLTTKHFYEL